MADPRLLDLIKTNSLLYTENAELRAQVAELVATNTDLLRHSTEVGHLLDDALERLRVNVISRM